MKAYLILERPGRFGAFNLWEEFLFQGPEDKCQRFFRKKKGLPIGIHKKKKIL